LGGVNQKFKQIIHFNWVFVLSHHYPMNIRTESRNPTFSRKKGVNIAEGNLFKKIYIFRPSERACAEGRALGSTLPYPIPHSVHFTYYPLKPFNIAFGYQCVVHSHIVCQTFDRQLSLIPINIPH